MKKISIDNGVSFIEPSEALKEVDMNVLMNYMDEEVMELISEEYAPCSDLFFLREYLDRAECDLIIG